jgi:hypothetical protein
MPAPDTLGLLNRVLVVLERSFPQYLRYARPYVPRGRANVMETINDVTSGQDALAERISQYIFESGGLADHGKFPIEFTDTHDLGIDFLIHSALGYQREDIANLEECVERLRTSPAAQSLAAEALGMAKGHLESLQELPINPAASTVIRNGPPARDND